MALNLGQGFASYLLKSINSITGEADPYRKLQIPGLTNYLMTRNPAQKSMVDLNIANGQERSVQVKIKSRLTKDFIKDGAIDCDITNVIAPFELPVDVDIKKWVAIYRSDDDMRKFDEESIRPVSIGQPTATIMQELFDDIIGAANGIIQELNDDLLAKVVSTFGVNRVTGVSTATPLNFNKDVSTNPLGDGPTRITTDFGKNQAQGRPTVIGSGNYFSWVSQQPAKGLDQIGFDTRIQSAQFDFFFDQGVESQIATNDIIVVENGALQLVEFFENMGSFAGPRPGQSEFFRMPLPMVQNGQVVPMFFDVQLRYEDCAKSFTDGYYGTTIQLNRGWNIIISKEAGLFSFGDAAYRATDVLNGNTGVYRYTINNNCESC